MAGNAEQSAGVELRISFLLSLPRKRGLKSIITTKAKPKRVTSRLVSMSLFLKCLMLSFPFENMSDGRNLRRCREKTARWLTGIVTEMLEDKNVFAPCFFCLIVDVLMMMVLNLQMVSRVRHWLSPMSPPLWFVSGAHVCVYVIDFH